MCIARLLTAHAILNFELQIIISINYLSPTKYCMFVKARYVILSNWISVCS
jgi:hypothetical protein